MTRNERFKISLIFGILYSVTYILTDIVTGFISPGYSFNSQTVSELSAIGAPTRYIWQFMAFVHNPLLIIFGFGIIHSADLFKNKILKLLGYLIIIWGVSGFLWLFFPMNLRGNIGSTGDTMHLVMTGFTVILMILIIFIGSSVLGKIFRYYSILTLIVMMVFGILTSLQTSRVALQLPTPWMGITERVTSYAPLIWTAVLASFLYKKLSFLKKRK